MLMLTNENQRIKQRSIGTPLYIHGRIPDLGRSHFIASIHKQFVTVINLNARAEEITTAAPIDPKGENYFENICVRRIVD